MRAGVHKPFLESTVFGHITSHYARFERTISSVSLFGGFVFDAITLKRVDTFWENFWVLAHLVLVAACILLINRSDGRSESPGYSGNPGSSEVPPRAKSEGRSGEASAGGKKRDRLRFWAVNALQFLFGGLLSTFLVFYFRSGSLRVSWPFFLLLAAAFIANEKLKHRLAQLEFQLGFFFLSLFSFLIFIVPVLVHAVGPVAFLLSGGASLIVMWLFMELLRLVGGDRIAGSKTSVTPLIGTLFLAINVLYFLNLIPPIPLSLQDASVGHMIAKTPEGNYLVESEDQGRLRYFRSALKLHFNPGTPVYVYSAVFSPTALNTNIVHEWQRYDKARGWHTVDRIPLPVRGGRGGGYRTYSAKSGVSPGAWRVNVETPSGAVLGRIRFDILASSGSPPAVKTEVKD